MAAWHSDVSRGEVSLGFGRAMDTQVSSVSENVVPNGLRQNAQGHNGRKPGGGGCLIARNP